MFVSLLLDGNRDRKIIDDEIYMTGEYLKDMQIKHYTKKNILRTIDF